MSSQVNFPIAFNSACLAVNVSVVTTDDRSDIESSVCNLPGLASFSLYYSVRRTRPIFWIAIGYWQWGSNTGGGSWHHFTFPIAFSTVFEIIGGYSTTSAGQIYGASNNITNTGFDMSIAKLDTGRYIAIGIWQWGNYAENGDFASHQFPIAFPNMCFNVLLSTWSPANTKDAAKSTTTLWKFDNASFSSVLSYGNGWRGAYVSIGC